MFSSFLFDTLFFVTSISVNNTNKKNTPLKENTQKEQSIQKNTLNFSKGFKDDIFSYIHGSWKDKKDGFTWVSYSQKRDLEERDEIPVKKAKKQWVDLSLKKKEKEYTYLGADGKEKKYLEISGGYKFINIFIHGLNGNRTWGFNDWSFGGNFNRVKHLTYLNKGTYISTDITSFSKGHIDMKNLLKKYQEKNKNIKIFMTCGSSGGEVCMKMYADLSIQLDGIIMLGSIPPYSIGTMKKRNIPIYYGHGEKDTPIPVKHIIPAYKELKKIRKNKIKLEVFTSGVHGTPIRMVDWLKVYRFMNQEK